MKIIEKPTLETFGTSAEEAVREMRFRIHQDTCLTASAGDVLVLCLSMILLLIEMISDSICIRMLFKLWFCRIYATTCWLSASL